MKVWFVKNLNTDRLLGSVPADWSEQAVSLAWSKGYRAFYVEDSGREREPSAQDQLMLAANQAGLDLAASQQPAAVVKVARPSNVWSPTHGFPVPKPKKSTKKSTPDTHEVTDA